MSSRRERTSPKPISGILRDVLESCGLSGRMDERSLLQNWSDIVGPEIAAHSRAVDIQDGELIIDADHGAWRQELSLLIPEIIKKFNAAYGEGAVKEVRWLNRPGRNRKSMDR
jgi:predicted nucleic acid-binding Zn ribbon protein